MLKISKEWFIDEDGRTVLLRGVNLGGSTKVPVTPNGATHLKTDFSDHRDVSYIGHPFPLKEADEHFRRLHHWGFNCLRFLVTWEAIEHKGPKQYDNEYLDYVEELLKIASQYGFYTFIDPHQDVWSRMTGGDGSPGWTWEKVGLDFTKFHEAGVSLVMQLDYDPNDPKKFPQMHWPSNSIKFPNRVIWTLFFGGNDFAPSFKIDGINAQDYLQNHFIDAIKQVASRVKDNDKIIGFDSLNEPNRGLIGFYLDGSNYDTGETMDYAFTPIDSLLTGAGYTRTVGYREIKRFGIKETRKDEINPNKVSCWLDGFEPIWKKEGVWGIGEDGMPVALKNDYFVVKDGKEVDFTRDYLSSFITDFGNGIREIIPDSIIFFEGHAESMLKGEKQEFIIPKNVVHAAHYYDVATLGTKRPMTKANFDLVKGRPVVGSKNVKEMFVRHLGAIKSFSKEIHGGVPTLIGEIGIPYDLSKGEAFEKFKIDPETAWDAHIKCLNSYYNALDANLLHSTQWNYTADNCAEWGDLWNQEDLSIFSRDQQTDPNDINSGGRALKGFCRPRFVCCAGTPIKMEFNRKEGTFLFEFEADASITAPTIIYVPKIHYPQGYKIGVSIGETELKDDEQIVKIITKESGTCTVKISR